MFDKLGFPVEKNRYHYYLFFYKNILDTCLGYHKQLQIKKFDVISRIWGAILLLLKWVKRTKHSCRQPQAKKCQGSKEQQFRKMPPGCSNPFFWGLKCAEMRVYCKVNGLNKFVDKSDFFLSLSLDSIRFLRLMRHCYASEYISDVKPIDKKVMLNLLTTDFSIINKDY